MSSEEAPTEAENNEETAQKPRGLKRFSLKTVGDHEEIDLDSLEIGELLDLRSKIDAKLPPLTIKDLNLEEELMLQFIRAKDLQSNIAKASDIPTNQKAQVANSVRATLSEIVKMQSELYSAEQFKRMEACLAKVLKTLPTEAQNAFFEAYGRAANELAGVPEPEPAVSTELEAQPHGGALRRTRALS
jgi:hypothetical protein